jgi:aspartate aminotransferase-like enzyme
MTGREKGTRVSSRSWRRVLLLNGEEARLPMEERLMTPGPTHIPPEVFSAMERPGMHHRTAEFREIFQKCCEDLQSLLDTETPPLLLTCSGSGAMEAALLNSCLPGQKVIVLNGGKFGERWSRIAERLKLKVVELQAEWGESYTEEALEKVLQENSDAAAFCVQQSETSTTVNHDLNSVSEKLRLLAPDTLFIVDAISSAGTLPLSAQALGIDLLVIGSQKALMLPPGLAGIAASRRGWGAIQSRHDTEPPHSLYFDLLVERKSQEKGITAWTTAMNIVLGLEKVLSLIESEGRENVYRRHATASRACRAGLRALGFQLLAESHPSPGVTGGFPPEGVNADELRATLLKESGIRIAGGQDHLKGKIIRIGHMGSFAPSHIIGTISALEKALLTCGAEFVPGAGIEVVQNAYSEN